MQPSPTPYRGARIYSTNAPIPSGDTPNNQFSATSSANGVTAHRKNNPLKNSM